MARWLGLSQAQLSRIENGPAIVHLDRLAHWAQLLQIPARLLWFALPEGHESGRAVSFAEVGKPILRPAGDQSLHFVRSLRLADRRVGGGHLYATVRAYLADTIAGPVAGGASPPEKTAFAAVASLNEMAGWMAHDSGAAEPARQHLGNALILAGRSDDHQLVAQVHAGLSHLANHCGDAHGALSHARNGLEHLRQAPSHGRLHARLLALQARGLAIAGQPVEATRTLADAETSMHGPVAMASEWLSPFDVTSFAIEAARCFLRVGDLSESQRRLRAALAVSPADRVRSRALAQLMLVTVLLGRGQIEEACAVTHEVMDEIASLGSGVIIDQLRHASVLFTSYATACAVVPPLLDRLRDTIRERSWIGAVGALQAGAAGDGQPG
ncbi:helix-turn-helix domain-containing protein [Micromonospora sp. NBS 11-29]|uniref:helix-turn-helix domain-containing protein n=1 Tax=Micromonospora sp. NBS 11-29 TaxID=1960879 RepID=UPI0020CDE2DF|nr:helix-turn-helix transcriptional regulator [Micromonospora sp. NBS 11-29]